MAKSTLPVNYQDDILNSAMSGKRRFKLINNSDGTVSLEDVTTYDQVGSNFGAGQMNATNQAVNESLDKNKVVRDLATIGAITQAGYVPDALALKEVNSSLVNENSESFNFGVKDGVRGFFTNPSRADDSFIPFKKNLSPFSCPFKFYLSNYSYQLEMPINVEGYTKFTLTSTANYWWVYDYSDGEVNVNDNSTAIGTRNQTEYDVTNYNTIWIHIMCSAGNNNGLFSGTYTLE